MTNQTLGLSLRPLYWRYPGKVGTEPLFFLVECVSPETLSEWNPGKQVICEEPEDIRRLINRFCYYLNQNIL